jgi:Rieske Fe-S protein
LCFARKAENGCRFHAKAGVGGPPRRLAACYRFARFCQFSAARASNAAERSWDCPCHGSRFDVDGGVLEGPATAPLERKFV